MASPVQIPDLPSATIANNADTTILRQGLTDYQCTMALIRNINVQALNNLPSTAQSSDYFLISRIISSVPTNFKIPFSSVSLPINTQQWFYMTSAQITSTLAGWALVPNTGDSLLACAGGTTYATAQTGAGTWTQPSFTLTLGQMPAHGHTMATKRAGVPGSSNSFVLAASAATGSSADDYTTDSVGSSTPVQPVNTWRPLAQIGNICKKIV
jgi:hypothetical protein